MLLSDRWTRSVASLTALILSAVSRPPAKNRNFLLLTWRVRPVHYICTLRVEENDSGVGGGVGGIPELLPTCASLWHIAQADNCRLVLLSTRTRSRPAGWRVFITSEVIMHMFVFNGSSLSLGRIPVSYDFIAAVVWPVLCTSKFLNIF
jgi:hypothetical protein